MSARTDSPAPNVNAALVAPPLPPGTPGVTQGPRQLLLLGAGMAHLEVLKALAKSPVAGMQITLVSPHAQLWHAATLPGFIAGHYRPEDCTVPLEPLVQRSGVHWIRASVCGLNADDRTVALDNGRSLHFDWLSINTGPVQNRDLIEHQIPGAREHALFIRPLDNFAVLWPQVCAMAASRALRVAVVGGGASGIETALAVQYRLPTAAVTLLSGPDPLASAFDAGVQQRLLEALKERCVTVLQDSAISIQADSVTLGCGATLACDVTVLATGTQPPRWLESSGLALDSHGFMSVDASQRSTSHATVFAAGDISSRSDAIRPRNGVFARRSGLPLARNLFRVIQGQDVQSTVPSHRNLQILSLGNRYAILTWGSVYAQGHWVWWLKHWLDRRYIRMNS